MSSQAYVVTGATGNIGSKIAHSLLSRNKTVRVIGRKADKLKPFAEKGADVFVDSLDDASAMAKAFEGAHAVFAMIPPNFTAPDFRAYQNRIGETMSQAIRKAGVQWVVNLSSIGAQRPDKLGPINGLYDQEQRLNALDGVNVLHLRPAYFMENQFMSLDLVRKMGINGSALRGDVSFPMIATADIAQVAADALLNLDFKDKSIRELLGPRDLSLQDATAILGKAIGKPDLKYVQFSYPDTEKALVGMGFSSDLARLFVEMARGGNDGLMNSTQGRSPRTTTPTPFEDFVKVLADAYFAEAVGVR